MKFIPRHFLTLLLIASSAVLPLAAAPATDSPDTVVQALYRSSLDHFGFDPATVKSSKPWVTPELYVRMWKKVNQPVPKGDAPDIEGDLFFDAQDLPTKYEVGKPSIDQNKAKVPVTVIFGGEKRHYTVLLEQIDGAWKVSDVHYGKDGNLTDLL